MALSADDLSFIRSMLPARTNVSSDPLYISDTQLNYLYSNKADSDIDSVIAWAWRQACAKASHLVSRSNTATGDSQSQQQEREAICEQASMWANIAGIPSGSVGVVTTGSINLGIDEEDSYLDIT